MANVVENRDDRILNAAIELALEGRYQAITRERVAARAGVSDGSVNNAFGTMDALKTAVIEAAVAREIMPIIAQGLADKHPATADIAKPLRLKAAQLLLG